MARIAEKNPRFRTKEVISRDIATILSLDLHHGTTHAILAEVMWVWSEFDGKYSGCRFWSIAARQCQGIKDLRHEHIVPKRYIIQSLKALMDPTPEDVYSIMSTYCIGAIVTKTEDTRLTDAGFKSCMPSSWDCKDVWIRYRLAGIEMEEIAEQAATGQPSPAALFAMGSVARTSTSVSTFAAAGEVASA